jgi:4-methylaminobutanoate oxidase (formaldehyde-forming)
VVGPGAADYLETLCDNRVARDVGRITYTQMLNARGGIECDFTVTRLAEDAFQIVTGTAFGQHDLAWIRRHSPRDGSVRVIDMTSRWACFGLWGPRASAVLAPLTPDALDFPYLSMREIVVGDVPVRALRVTFVGELGWELYAPAEYGAALWRTLWEAGEPHGLAAGGYRAIDSLRLEKGYRVWGTDITPDETPHEAGLGFCVRDDKDFIGAAALREREVHQRLACIVLDDPRSVALGNEPVAVDGRVVGRVTSGGFGYTVAASIAYAYMPLEHTEPGTEVAIDVFGRWVPGHVAAEPLYDPAGERVKGLVAT